MKTHFHKEYCRQCGKAYDSALGNCPYCGTQSVDFNEVKGFKEMTPMGWGKELALFLIGWLGFQIIGLLVSFIVLSVTKGAYESAGLSGASLQAALTSFKNSVTYAGAIDFSVYVILFCVMLVVLDRDIYRISKRFKMGKSYFGFLAGFGIMMLSVLYNLIIQNVIGSTESNANQSIINALIASNPLLSIVVFAFIGPFCEELTYRVGLFGFLKRINPYLAYIGTALLFGAIHMDITNLGSVIEWAYFPDYVISGFLFSLLYDKLGFGASYTAHFTNNFISVVMTILVNAVKK
jgi:membrane protease YdiL (CAAX protease family)